MITVNLTTTPARLPYIAPALDSLNKQTMKADKIFVHYPYEFLPVEESMAYQAVKNYCKDARAELCWKDWGPATKLIASLEDKSDIIVTADDDVIYPENWLETLYVSWFNLNVRVNNNCAAGFRGKILDSNSYKESTCIYATHESEVDIITGTWGAIYKAEWFDVDELKQWFTQNQPESHYCDDIVINSYLKSKGIGRYCIKSESEFKPTKAHSINALWDINKDADYNDTLIKRLGLC